ncbi:MAG: M16 family metallopeptidase [Candidatus Binataceae bacterium]
MPGARRIQSETRGGRAWLEEPLDWRAARIPATVARLANGLTVVAHCDRKASVVAVEVVYRAGSREEPAGKSGLAHICEHLMYSGTTSVPGSYFRPFERAGAVYINARVTEDYSAYFATVPVGALDFALWMEADRMGNLPAAMTSTKFDLQREVVRNELMQRESEPFGRAPAMIAALTHSAGHPYAHPSNGIFEQLDNITCADALEWIHLHHVAADAVLSISGDIRVEAAIERAHKYFGSVHTGVAYKAPARNRAHHVRASAISIDAKNCRLYLIWPAPAFAHADYAVVEAACELLNGKHSRLWRRICLTERLASDITIELHPRQLDSQIILSATPLPGIAPNVIKAAIVDELERCGQTLSAVEIDTARVKLFAKLVRTGERVGGPQGKSDTLAISTVLGGHPAVYHCHVSTFAALRPRQVGNAIQLYLNREPAVLEFGESTG